MMMGQLNGDEGDEALVELARLMSGQLLRDRSIADCGSHLVFHGSAGDFKEKLLAALAESVADIPRDRLLAILMGKVRKDRSQNNEPNLPDDELPPGFSSN